VTNLELLVPRFSSFKDILLRLKRFFVAYKILPFPHLNRKFEFIKVKSLRNDEIIKLVQDELIDHIEFED
jgi:hypothetical protein